jgi:hypothetical protein
MRGGYYYRITWLVIFLFFSSECYAAALPVFTGRMNRAVRSVIETKLHKRFPFAANDPRFNLAMTAIDVGVTVATGAAVGAAWPEILILLGANALMSYAVPLAVNKFRECISMNDYKLNINRNWLFTDGNKIMDTGLQRLPAGSISTSCFLKQRYSFNLGDENPKTIPPGNYRYMFNIEGNLVKYSVLRLSLNDVGRFARDPVNINFYGRSFGLFKYHDDLTDCLFCRYILDGAGRLINMYNLKEIDISDYDSKTASNAIADLPEEIFQQELSPDMLALAANAVWRSANLEVQSENFSWSVDDPITAEDIEEWLDLHPDLTLTVGDFVAPAAPPEATSISLDFSTNYKPMSMPSVAPNLAVAFTPVSNVVPDSSYDTAENCAANENLDQDQNQDLDQNQDQDQDQDQNQDLDQDQNQNQAPDPDEDPDTSLPDLEDIPTAWMILEPILNLMSDLKNFSVPSHISVCPVASFTVLGNEYRFQVHCDLIEQHRELIETTMVLAWALIALGIVLRA